MKKMLMPLSLVLLMTACVMNSTPIPTNPPQVNPTATPTLPLPANPTATPTLQPPVPCELVADSETIIYQRPSAAADIFSSLGAGERAQVAVRTADGFWGFEPDVAQAGNVGLFRNRWVLNSHTVHLEGDCEAILVVVAPIAGICYAMSMGDTPVYTSSDTGSPVMSTLHVGDYAMVFDKSPGWANVDLDVSNLLTAGTGWVEEANIGYNGNCP